MKETIQNPELAKDSDTSNVLKGTLLKTAPTIPSRPGYGSPSWYDDAGNLVDFTTGVVINSDMVFSAVYPSLGTPHNVTFKNLDGSTFTTNPVYDGDFAANPGPPADMDIMKQELVDWVEELTHDSISKFTVTGDVAFVPVVKNKWKVEFEVEGTIDSTYTTYVSDGGYATYAGANPVPSDATKVFDKWVVKSTSDEMSVTPITGDTIFEAQFVEKPPSSVSVQSVSAPEYNGWQSLKYKIVLLNTTPDDVYDWSLSFDIPSSTSNNSVGDWKYTVNQSGNTITTYCTGRDSWNSVVVPAGGTLEITVLLKAPDVDSNHGVNSSADIPAGYDLSNVTLN